MKARRSAEKAAPGRKRSGQSEASDRTETPDRTETSPANRVEALLGYRFERAELLTLALTHSSFVYEARLGRAKTSGDEPNEPGTDNEQLEFLGDAVLGLAVTELLLREFPGRSEGELTRMRSSLVSRKRLATLGEHLQLSPAIRLGRSAETGEGRQKMAVLANTAEALLGAVYMDVSRAGDSKVGGERALGTVRSLVETLLLEPDLPSIRTALEEAPGRGALRDAKSRLQERVQAEAAGRLMYVDTGETGPAHERNFAVEVRLERKDGRLVTLGRGEGGSKKEAQQAAATLALSRWDEGAEAIGVLAEQPR